VSDFAKSLYDVTYLVYKQYISKDRCLYTYALYTAYILVYKDLCIKYSTHTVYKVLCIVYKDLYIIYGFMLSMQGFMHYILHAVSI
jgi:hypothetical protein